MKAKNFLILLIGILFISFHGYSQDKRFIEVIVSDTVNLKCTQIKYEIRSGDQNDMLGMRIPRYDDETEEDEIPAPTNAEIMQLLDRSNYNYATSEAGKYTVSDDNVEPSIIVTLKNEAELKKLTALLKSEDGISGNISEVAYESIDKYHDSLFKELYNQALTQASKMAALSNNSVGQLLSVSYVKNDFDGIMDYYKEFMKKMPASIFGSNVLLTKNEELKMVFKFELLSK